MADTTSPRASARGWPVSRWARGWPASLAARRCGGGGRRPSTWATGTVEPEPVGQGPHLVGQAGRVEASGVGDHLDAAVDAGAEHLFHLGEEGVGPALRVVALAALPQDEHGELGQPVPGEHVDGAALDHLPGRREPVAVEARAVGDAQRLGHGRSAGPRACGSVSGAVAIAAGVDDHQDPSGLHLVALGHVHLGHGARGGGVHGVLHLHGLEHHQELPGLDRVAHGHRHPDHAAGHRGQRRSCGHLTRRPAGTAPRSTSVELPSGPST